MIPVLLIVIPLLSGLIAFLVKQEKSAKAWALFSSLITLAISVAGVLTTKQDWLAYNKPWLENFGSSFNVGLDGMGKLLVLLTGISFPVIFLATWNSTYKKASNFFALMLLSQAGLMGVFVAMDALLFY